MSKGAGAPPPTSHLSASATRALLMGCSSPYLCAIMSRTTLPLSCSKRDSLPGLRAVKSSRNCRG